MTVADEKKEQRFAPRRGMRIPALFYIDGISGGVACSILDVSTTGARIEVKEGWDASIRFSETARLRLVERVEKVSYDCRIVRRGPGSLGLKFLSAPVLAAPVPKRVKRS